MNTRHLALSWSVSRGRDTYGYNICRLDDNNTDQRYKCMGGGYDMIGTVFGDWLQQTYQATLQNAGDVVTSLYGAKKTNLGMIYLDGATGIESMIAIAEAIGLEVKRLSNRKGHTTGFLVGVKTA